MASAAQLVDQGVRAYVEGRADDARRLLDEALRLEPGNARARSYMILLHGSLPAVATPQPGTIPAVRAPAPAAPPASPPIPASPPTPVADLPLPSGERAGVRGTSGLVRRRHGRLQEATFLFSPCRFPPLQMSDPHATLGA
jgi:hypothetical protein